MISIIVATSKNGVIGHLNKLPWYLPRDLKHFASLTTGHTALMGRKTYESIINRLGHPLPNRKNVILTNQKNFQAPGCTVVNSWEEAMEQTAGEEVFVSGGAEIYKIALPHTDRIYLTLVDMISDGDVFFEFDESKWQAVSEEFHAKDEKNPYDCTFITYDRKK